jgi:predicted transcriptional regulator
MTNEPTERELQILKVLWDRGGLTVREVYEALREDLPIVQNTVQAFLRTMEEKGQVRHHVEGRTFVYSPVLAREATSRGLVSGLLERMFDGAVDQLVESALSLRKPTEAELTRLKKLVDAAARESAGRSRSI